MCQKCYAGIAKTKKIAYFCEKMREKLGVNSGKFVPLQSNSENRAQRRLVLITTDCIKGINLKQNKLL